MSQLKETCNLLDETLLDYFTTLEEVYKKQTELNDCIKEGFLLMAKVMVPSNYVSANDDMILFQPFGFKYI